MYNIKDKIQKLIWGLAWLNSNKFEVIEKQLTLTIKFHFNKIQYSMV